MQSTNIIKGTAVGLCLLTVFGCSTPTKQTTDASTVGTQESQTYSATSHGIGADSGQLGGSDMASEESLKANNIVYFDFDKSDIKESFMETLSAHASYLSAHANTKIRISGHADERGTREYNIALGERRAQAVAEILMLNGVAKSQMEIISYGEEAPVALGHDEASWSLNRRAELNY